MASIPHTEWQKVSLSYRSGLSMREIAETYKVSVDAVTYVLRKQNEPRRTASETNKLVFERSLPSFSIKDSKSSSAVHLQILGVALYWAEGYKTKKAKGVDFANSNPAMVRTFISFLRSRYRLDESRFRISLYCHKNQNIEKIIAYWSTLLDVPSTQFTKPYVRNEVREVHRTMPYGLVHIRYSDKKMLIDILNLIDSYSREFRVGTQAVNEDAL